MKLVDKMNPQPLDLGEIKKRIEECFNQLENMFEYGGDESEDGELYPGVPDWEKAKRKIYNILIQRVKSAVDGLLAEIRDRRLSLGLYDEQYDEICEMIRRWFPDVLEDDKNDNEL